MQLPTSVDPTPARSTRTWSTRAWGMLLAALSLSTLLLHGFHPFAEDGGVYAAGVEYTLDPSLFPLFTAFVTEHLRFSLFAPWVALFVRLSHLPLSSALLLIDFAAALFTMVSARELLRRCFPQEPAQLAGLALLAAGWTLPIAGTSLYLMDPYVTARTLTLPLSLLAAALALDPWPRPSSAKDILRHPAMRCAACLLLAAAVHPLMAGYALLFVVALRATVSPRHTFVWPLLSLLLLLSCALVSAFAPADTPAERIAVITRYYWFLSQWQWYERLGLLGPFVMLGLTLRARSASQGAVMRPLTHATLLLGLLATLCALLFAHESAPSHILARLQPLRIFVLIYAVMLLLLGAALYRRCMDAALHRRGALRATVRCLPALATAAMGAGLFFAARATYPASPHIELSTAQNANPWVQAFRWARSNTLPNALFALDAKYVNTEGEDAQTFRAISLRSALPDYSKDGGEASITPALAPAWLAGAEAQKGLSDLSDIDRDHRLQPFGVTWMVLHASASTAHDCPYRNLTVKVCRLQP